MALNPLLPLSVRTATPFTSFQQGRAGEAQNQLLEANVRGVERQEMSAEEQTKAIERFRNVETGVKQLSPVLDQAISSGDPTTFMQALQDRRQSLLDQGITDTSDTDLAIQTAQSGNLGGVRQLFDQVLSKGEELNRQDLGLGPERARDVTVPTEIRTREQLLTDATNPDIADTDPRKISAMIDLGLTPRAGTETAEERVARDQELAGALSEVDALRAAAKETGKLSAQLGLKPEVDAAVKTAVATATLQADAAKEDRSNQRALNVYDTALVGLVSALGETATGPAVGLMPAITSNQQIADGAVAAMAPVLKQLFRSAGEGIFTDRDQDLLLEMVPTRTDTPDSRVAKLKNIDAIIRAKLEPLDGAPQATAPAIDAQSAIEQARQAIAAGADPNAVLQRLNELGVDTSGL